MATLAESLISSTSRPLTLRMRPDLNARRHRYHGRTFWVVKEPVGLNYFRFHDEEFAILCMLDGRSSLDDIKDEFETALPRDAPLFNEYHALFVRVGKDYCKRAAPNCESCPLAPMLPASGVVNSMGG